jgi:hypothetical protein
LINQISFVLRPGGLVFLAEFDFHVYDGMKRPVNAGTDTTGSSLARWMAHWKSAISRSGGSAEVSTSMIQWITQHRSFEDVVQEEYWIPTSPWSQGTDPESAKYRSVAELVRNGVMVGPLTLCIPFIHYRVGICHMGPIHAAQQWATRGPRQQTGRQCRARLG